MDENQKRQREHRSGAKYLRRDLMKLLIERIEIHETDVRIVYKVPQSRMPRV